MKLLDRFRFAFFIIRNGGELSMNAIGMMYVYAISEGLNGMTFKDVPTRMKPTVKILLEGLGLGELAIEE